MPQQHATICGQVTYREGDGANLRIPEGPVEVDVGTDSVVLRWSNANGAAGQAALTRSQYEQYLLDGHIAPRAVQG